MPIAFTNLLTKVECKELVKQYYSFSTNDGTDVVPGQLSMCIAIVAVVIDKPIITLVIYRKTLHWPLACDIYIYLMLTHAISLIIYTNSQNYILKPKIYVYVPPLLQLS